MVDPFNPAHWHPNLDLIEQGNDRYLAFQNEDLYLPFFGLMLHCPPGVYKPTVFSSTVLATRSALLVAERIEPQSILEIGSGSGAIGFMLKEPDNTVTLTDISPVAVKAMKANAQKNGLDIEILESDLFDAVQGRQFDLVIFNMPYVNRSIGNSAEVALNDPEGKLVTRFLKELPDYLPPQGWGLLTFSNLSLRAALQEGLAPYTYRLEQYDFNQDLNVYRWVISLPKP